MKHTRLMLGMLLLTSLTVVSQQPQVADQEAEAAALRIPPFFRNLFVNNLLQVSGTTDLNGQTNVNGNLVVNGNETINGSLTVNGPVTFASETISGCITAQCATITDDLIVNNILQVDGCITATCLTVNGQTIDTNGITQFGYFNVNPDDAGTVINGTAVIFTGTAQATQGIHLSDVVAGAIVIDKGGAYAVSWTMTSGSANENVFALYANDGGGAAIVPGTAVGMSPASGTNTLTGYAIIAVPDDAVLTLVNVSDANIILASVEGDQFSFPATISLVRLHDLS